MLPQVSLARARAALVLDEGVEHTDNNSFDFTVSDHCRTYVDVKKISVCCIILFNIHISILEKKTLGDKLLSIKITAFGLNFRPTYQSLLRS